MKKEKIKITVGAGPVSAHASKARQKNGITLIALIITIVVMLILVSVTITMAKNGGLFEKAGDAVGKTENAIDKEQELASGKITIGGTTYNSIDEYLYGASENKNSLTFFVTSDNHLDSTANNYESILKTIRKTGTLANENKADFIVDLGDTISGKHTKNKSIQGLQTLVNETRNSTTVPIFFVKGNHDDNGWYSEGYGGFYQTNEMINDEEWNTIVNNTGNITKDINNSKGAYFYYDDEKTKTRVFMLDTEDIPYYIDYKPLTTVTLQYIDWEKGEYYIKNGDTYIKITEDEYNAYSTKPQLYLHGYRYSSYEGHAFRDAQLEFVAESLLSMQNDWGALFLMHVPLDTSREDGERFGGKDALIRNHDILLAIITAWKNGTKCVLSGDGGYVTEKALLDKEGDFAYDINVDFTNRGKGEVIAFISGHTHWNNTSDEVGFQTSLSYGYRYISIDSRFCSKISINRENKTISVVRHAVEVILPSNTTDQYVASGVKEGSVYSGSLASGSYVVEYKQFYPEIKNLLNTNWNTTTEYTVGHNMSVDMSNYEVTLGNTNTNTNYETFLVAIPVKPYTSYTLGSFNQNGIFIGEIIAMTREGGRSMTLTKTTNQVGNTVIKTGPRHYSIVIMVNKAYKDGLMVVEGESLPENYISY